VRVDHRSVDRRAGEAEAEGVRQLRPHGDRKSLGTAFPAVVAFVVEHDSVVAQSRLQIVHPLETSQGRDDGFARPRRCGFSGWCNVAPTRDNFNNFVECWKCFSYHLSSQ